MNIPLSKRVCVFGQSGVLAAFVTLVYLLAGFDNVVLPHYEEVAYSVATRCKIDKISDDSYIGDKLKHYAVKFPLPGIPGLRDGEATCYASQSCIKYTVWLSRFTALRLHLIVCT